MRRESSSASSDINRANHVSFPSHRRDGIDEVLQMLAALLLIGLDIFLELGSIFLSLLLYTLIRQLMLDL